MKRVGRSTFRRIYWGSLLCLLILFALSTMASTGRGGRKPPEPLEDAWRPALACVFLAWLFLGRSIAHRFVPLLVSTILCPGCEEEIDPVDVWDCTCGFHDYRERHILAGYCPSCGKAAGHLNCSRCNC